MPIKSKNGSREPCTKNIQIPGTHLEQVLPGKLSRGHQQWITKKNYIVARGTQLNTTYSGCAPLLNSNKVGNEISLQGPFTGRARTRLLNASAGSRQLRKFTFFHRCFCSQDLIIDLSWHHFGACVATISLFSEISNEEFSNTCNVKPAVFEELYHVLGIVLA